MASAMTKQRSFLQKQAIDWQKAAKNRLLTSLGVAPGMSPPRSSFPKRQYSKGYTAYLERSGQLNLQYGQTPNDVDVAKYIKQIGGNPYRKKLQELKNPSRRPLVKPNVAAVRAAQNAVGQARYEASEDKRLQAFIADAQAQDDAANAANESRYEDILGVLGQGRDRIIENVGNYGAETRGVIEDGRDRLISRVDEYGNETREEIESGRDRIMDRTEAYGESSRAEGEDLRSRNMDRVANYGVAAKYDLEERAAESLGNQRASLSGRGLGNSTIFDSFRQRNDRDLGNEVQRLSERVDSRSAEYDTALTNSIMDREERNVGQLSQYDSQFTGQMAGLIERLGQTQAGYDQQGIGNIAQLLQSIGQRQTDLDRQFTSDAAGVMERKTETGGDWNAIQAMIRDYGAGNAGRGFNADGAQQAAAAPAAQRYSVPQLPSGDGSQYAPIFGNMFGNPAAGIQQASYNLGNTYSYQGQRPQQAQPSAPPRQPDASGWKGTPYAAPATSNTGWNGLPWKPFSENITPGASGFLGVPYSFNG